MPAATSGCPRPLLHARGHFWMCVLPKKWQRASCPLKPRSTPSSTATPSGMARGFRGQDARGHF